MGWGILGGSAVTAYQKAAKDSRDAQWEDQQRAEWARQRAQDVAIDAAANGSDEAVKKQYEQASQAGSSLITPEFLKSALPGLDDAATSELAGQMKGVQDPQQAAAIVRQFQQDPRYARQAPAVAAPGEQFQAAAPTARAVDNPSLRAYRGDDGQMYMTAGEHHEPKPSELLMNRARAMMTNGQGGVKGMQIGMQLQQHAMEMMKTEQVQELNGIMTGRDPVATKVQKLVGMINGSPVVPGEASLEKGPDGIYLVHDVPGKAEPFKQKLQGNSPEEILQNLALSVRSMTNPELMLKRQEHEMKIAELAMHKEHFNRMDDSRDEKNQMTNQYQLGLLDARSNALALQQQLGLARIETAQARGERGNWMPYGTHADGRDVLYDNNTGNMKFIGGGNVTPDDVKKIAPFNKVTGDKGASAGNGRLPQTLTDSQKIAYPRALEELSGDPTPAERLKVSRKYNLPPELLGAPVLPSPTALGAPPAAAAPGKGLQLGAAPAADPTNTQRKAATMQRAQAAVDAARQAYSAAALKVTQAQQMGNRALVLGAESQMNHAKIALDEAVSYANQFK